MKSTHASALQPRGRALFRVSLLTAVLVLAACATSPTPPGGGPGQLPADGPVSVAWQDPLGFSERAQGRDRFELREGRWVRELAGYLRERAAARLPAGQRMEVTLLDIDRAGDYEPWRGPQVSDIRIMRDLYPPRIQLRFRQVGPDGQILAEGERRLVGYDFLNRVPVAGGNDALRHEKRLLDDWLRREFPPR